MLNKTYQTPLFQKDLIDQSFIIQRDWRVLKVSATLSEKFE